MVPLDDDDEPVQVPWWLGAFLIFTVLAGVGTLIWWLLSGL